MLFFYLVEETSTDGSSLIGKFVSAVVIAFNEDEACQLLRDHVHEDTFRENSKLVAKKVNPYQPGIVLIDIWDD